MLDSEASVTAELTKPALAVAEIAAGALLVTVLVVVLGAATVCVADKPVLAVLSGVGGMELSDITVPLVCLNYRQIFI